MSREISLPLQSIFWSQDDHTIKRSLLMLVGVLVLAFSAQLSIPLTPVPLTFESATVILIGMAYGPRYGTYVVAAYLFAGATGLPVFADFSGGIIKFFGPTGGYLLGFLPAAWLSGYLAQHGFAKNSLTSFVAGCFGVSIIFASGVLYLAHLIGWEKAIAFGLMPFIASEIIKLVAVSFFIPKLWQQQQ